MELEQEITAVYHEHAAGLLRYGASLLRNSDEARDAVQEVFLRYFTERRYGRTIHNPRAWLYQTLRNHLLNRLKSASSREVSAEVLEGMASGEQTPETMVARRQLVDSVCAKLTDRERDCLLFRTEGLSYEEIGAALAICTGTVGALMARVYRKIRGPAARVFAQPALAGRAVSYSSAEELPDSP